MAGLRVFGALVAGTRRMPWRKFFLYNALGGAVWATAAVSAGYFLWVSIRLVEHWRGKAPLVLVVLVLGLILYHLYRRSMRGRDATEPSGRREP